jgi:hypothetical protein
MDNIYIKLLQEFEKTGLSTTKSISKFMAQHFKKPTAIIFTEWEKQSEDARLFIDDVCNTGHFDIKEYQKNRLLWNSVENSFKWFDEVEFNAKLTIEGLAYLENYKTNLRVTANSNTQTLAILLTVLLTGITLVVTLNNATYDRQIDTLQTHLREQTLQIHTLQMHLSQATNELLLERERQRNIRKKSLNHRLCWF